MLSCDYDYDPEPGDICWQGPRGWTTHNRKRLPKCCSCGAPVPQEKCLEFARYKIPEHEIECRIYGEDGDQGPPRASWFMCFECGWRYLALDRHGYAVDINEDMRQLMIEHDDLAEQGLAGCR